MSTEGGRFDTKTQTDGVPTEYDCNVDSHESKSIESAEESENVATTLIANLEVEASFFQVAVSILYHAVQCHCRYVASSF